MMKIAVAAVIAAVSATAGIGLADPGIKDAKVGTYVRIGADKLNLRLDTIERVDHIDGRPIAASQDLKNAANGYTILSFSLQNAGDANVVRPIGISEIFDDESEIDGHSSGPFIGSGVAYFNQHLEKNQTVHIRIVQMNTPADRKITKIIVIPSDGGPKLRYSVKDAEIPRLAEVPLPATP